MKKNLLVNPLVIGCLLGAGVAQAELPNMEEVFAEAMTETLENSKGIVISIDREEMGLENPSFTARIHNGDTDVYSIDDVDAAWGESVQLGDDSFRFGNSDVNLFGEAVLVSCRTHPSHYRHIHRLKYHSDRGYSKRHRKGGHKGPGQYDKGPVQNPSQGKVQVPVPEQRPTYEQKGPKQDTYQRTRRYDRHRTVRHFPGQYSKGDKSNKGDLPRQRPSQNRKGGKGYEQGYSKWHYCHTNRWHRPWSKVTQHPGQKGSGKHQQRVVYKHKGNDYKYQKPMCKDQKQGPVKCYYPRSI